MKTLTELLSFLFEFFIPRFIEEWVMLEEIDDVLIPVCSELDVNEFDNFKWMARVKTLSWFGVGLFPQFGEPVEFDEKELKR